MKAEAGDSQQLQRFAALGTSLLHGNVRRHSAAVTGEVYYQNKVAFTLEDTAAPLKQSFQT
jgi:hypothetical protein